MKHAFQKAVGAAATALCLSTASIISVQAAPHDLPETGLIADAASLKTEEAQSCRFYTNILETVDEKWIDGATNAAHKDMAETAVQTILAIADYYVDDITTTKTGTTISSITFANGHTVNVMPASQSMSGYGDHCAYINTYAKELVANDNNGLKLADYYYQSINAVLSMTRDPHTSFHPPEDSKKIREQTRGGFAGVGVQVNKEDGKPIKIDSIVEGGPAGNLGILPGDMITHVDGKPVADMPLKKAIDLIKGAPGTDVVLTIDRPSQHATLQVTVTRDFVANKVVTAELRGDTGHVRISTFNEQTYTQFVQAIQSMITERAVQGLPLKKLVLDFRDNSGGLLSTALMMADSLINTMEGQAPERFMSTGTAPDNGEIYKDDDTNRFNFPDFDVRVLLNERSASASEVMAGALQDAGAKIVGYTSFGKGSVQTIFSVDENGELTRLRSKAHSTLRLTTQRFYPGSRALTNQGHGIPPTVEVVNNDLRDAMHKQDAHFLHEDTNKSSLIPVGQTRESIPTEQTCTLNPDVAGIVQDSVITQIATEMTDSFIFQSFPAEEQEKFESDPGAWNKKLAEIITDKKEAYEEMVKSNEDYVRKFVANEPAPVDEKAGIKSDKWELAPYFDTVSLCAQESLDGTQELTYKGVPVTSLVPYNPPKP